jgi:endonuclease/exonuclease/phosphatase family metal-dependent hydrolase
MSSRLLVVAFLAVASACAPASAAFVTSSLEACDPSNVAPTRALRVVSFNIRSGLSSSLEAVGDVIAGLEPDVVALQEVDVGVERTGRVDQAAVLAERRRMQRVFAGAIKREGGDYGVALLSRFPITRAERVDLRDGSALEPRVAIDASVCVNGSEVRVVSVHADMWPWAAEANTKELAEALKARSLKPAIIAGDLNATPQEKAVGALLGVGLIDVLRARDEGRTFLGSSRRIDYILADDGLDLQVTAAGRVEADVSDHVPVFAEFSAP